jgi:hypothetical protein
VNAFIKFAAALSLAAVSLHAQAFKAPMEAIKMPAPRIDKTDNIDYPGDYGYWFVGSSRKLDNVDLGDPKNWNWVRYTNTGNAKEVWAQAGMADNVCNHAHLNYGLWGKYTFNIGPFKSSTWTRLGMGTQSADKLANGTCKWDVDNSSSRFGGPDFGWGTNYMTANYKNMPFKFTEFVFGILGSSHGSGTCAPSFACGHQVKAYLWTIP